MCVYSPHLVVFYSTGEPTYHGSIGVESTIDFACSNLNYEIDTELETELVSDHTAVAFTIRTSFVPVPRMCRDVKNANWDRFVVDVRAGLIDLELNNEQQIDTGIDNFVEVIKNAYNTAVPLIEKRNDRPDIISENSKGLIREKTSIRRRMQRCKSIEERELARAQLAYVTKLVKSRVNDDRNRNW